MYKLALIGCGKIGEAIAKMLAGSGDYALSLIDQNLAQLAKLESLPNIIGCRSIDITDTSALTKALEGHQAAICALSYQHCLPVAESAHAMGLSYFDLTEDVAVSTKIQELAASTREGQIIMPQCGLAPGFIAIVAKHLANQLDTVDKIQLRVGALPIYPTNSLKYNLTWSTDGLINEYCQDCQTLHHGSIRSAPALSELETISIDGTRYEAFHTSGGIGTLCQTLSELAYNIDYKTIRYPGHRDYMRFLIEELKLGDRRALLREILESAIPATQQDYVLSFCNATGWKNGQLHQISDARKIYHAHLEGEHISAIQFTTAASLCAVVDLFFHQKLKSSGFMRQEDVLLEDFLANRFGKFFHIGNDRGTRVTQPTTIT